MTIPDLEVVSAGLLLAHNPQCMVPYERKKGDPKSCKSRDDIHRSVIEFVEL